MWKPVVGFEGIYSVSDQGQVRRDVTGRILKTRLDRGWHKLSLSKNGKVYTRRVHRIVMEAFVGPRPDGMEVCHIDSNKDNNRLSNLKYDTHRNNMLERVRLLQTG